MNRAVGCAITEKAYHADGIVIVVFQPMLRCVHDARFDIAGGRDNRGAFVACVHQTIEEMCRSRSGCATQHRRLGGEIRLCYRREGAVVLVVDRDELDHAVAAQSIDQRIQSVSNNAVAASDVMPRKHRPHNVCNRF